MLQKGNFQPKTDPLPQKYQQMIADKEDFTRQKGQAASQHLPNHKLLHFT